MKATALNGDLNVIPNIYIKISNVQAGTVLGFNISGGAIITPKIMPELSDGKGTVYSGENIPGRSFPVKTFSHSEDRAFSLEWKFIALKASDIQNNLRDKRLLESCLYPRDEISGSPFMPPPVCQIKYGRLLGDFPICAILKNYSIKYDTTQVFDPDTMLPYRFDMSLQFEAMYASSNLPGQEKIARMGM